MKIKVLKSFVDKYDRSKGYKSGDILDWSDDVRINNCVIRGLIETVPEENTETTEEPKPKKTTTKKAKQQ